MKKTKWLSNEWKRMKKNRWRKTTSEKKKGREEIQKECIKLKDISEVRKWQMKENEEERKRFQCKKQKKMIKKILN